MEQNLSERIAAIKQKWRPHYPVLKHLWLLEKHGYKFCVVDDQLGCEKPARTDLDPVKVQELFLQIGLNKSVIREYVEGRIKDFNSNQPDVFI